MPSGGIRYYHSGSSATETMQEYMEAGVGVGVFVGPYTKLVSSNLPSDARPTHEFAAISSSSKCNPPWCSFSLHRGVESTEVINLQQSSVSQCSGMRKLLSRIGR